MKELPPLVDMPVRTQQLIEYNLLARTLGQLRAQGHEVADELIERIWTEYRKVQWGGLN